MPDELDDIRERLSITQSDHTSRLTRLEENQRRQAETLGRVEAGIQDILALLRRGEDRG